MGVRSEATVVCEKRTGAVLSAFLISFIFPFLSAFFFSLFFYWLHLLLPVFPKIQCKFINSSIRALS